MKPVAVDIPEMALVEKDDLEDGSSDKFGQEGLVGTPKIAQVETKLSSFSLLVRDNFLISKRMKNQKEK